MKVMPRSPAPVVSVERFFEFSLLGLVASGYLAVVSSGYLDLPTALLTAAGLLLRALLVAGVVRLELSGRAVAAVTIAYMAFYPLDYLFVSGEFLTATVHLLFFLAVMKILTASTPRDHAFVAVIAFLELLAASILSTNLHFFVSLACFLLFGVAAFASAEIRRSARKPNSIVRRGLRNFHWRLAALSLSIATGILILTGGLFFLLPRTAQAAFQRLVPQRYHIPGFSNEVTLGAIGEIQQRATPMMHVRINGPASPGGLRWRGVALSQFDGRRWFNPSSSGVPLHVSEGFLKVPDNRPGLRSGTLLNYEVQLSPMASDALFFAGTPELIQINVPLIIRTFTDSYRLPFGVSGVLRYGALSSVEASLKESGASSGTARPDVPMTYLQLPGLDPRIPALARTITSGQLSDLDRARTLEAYLRSRYGYTTRLLSAGVDDPLAHFLFERREGHCEYFASALAVLLRTLSIPSRVVNGFQSGMYNPVSGWYVIRASDAHSWVEAWVTGRGWVTFDPTPPGPPPGAPTLWTKLGLYIDAADTFWNEWVLNYDLDRQLTLASRMESSGRLLSHHWLDRLRDRLREAQAGALPAVREHGGAFAVLVFLGALALVFWPRLGAWWSARERVREAKRGGARPSDATLLYGRMLRVLKRRGFEKPAWLTPAEFARLLPASDTAVVVSEFTNSYNALRFGADTAAAVHMVMLLERLEEAPAVGRERGTGL
jgi:transglutaminase-like putative cysteine protease